MDRGLSLTRGERKLKLMNRPAPYIPRARGFGRGSAAARLSALLLALVEFGARGGELPGISPVDEGYSVMQWTVEDGLPMRNVTALAQTTNGFLWCGTFDGLARFDGLEFKVFYPHEVPELAGFRIVQLLGDANGRIWILDADGKLAVRESNQFRRLESGDGLPTEGVRGIRESAAGDIWLWGRKAGGIWRLRTNQFDRVTLATESVPELSDCWVGAGDAIWGIRNDDDGLTPLHRTGEEKGRSYPSGLGQFFQRESGAAAVLSPAGIYEFQDGSWSLEHAFAGRGQISPPLVGCEDRAGVVWLGTQGGGLLRVAKDGVIARVTLPAEPSDVSVNAILRGREGNVWAGSSAGLYRISRNIIKSWSEAEGFPREEVRSLAEDSEQRLWIAQAGRLSWKAAHSNGLVDAKLDRAKPGIWRVARASAGGVWVATKSKAAKQSEILQVTPGHVEHHGQIPVEQVEDLLETTAGELLVASSDGLYQRSGQGFQEIEFPAEPGRRMVTALAEDRLGRVYAAVTDVGLCRREPGGWQRLTERSEPGSDRIQALRFDSAGVLWIATDRPGLACWKNDHWFSFTNIASELPRKARGLQIDQQDGLWLTSRWGLARVSRQELAACATNHGSEVNVAWFDTDAGLASADCAVSASGVCLDVEGRIWVATARGVSMIDPAEWERRRKHCTAPPIRIERVTVDDVVLETTADSGAARPPRLVVPPGSQRVEIRFAAVNLTAPDKMRFRYRLEGFDDKWNTLVGLRQVHFTRLPPGDYRFQVCAANNEGIWNRSGASLSLSVRPEWWQRTTLRAAAGLGLLGMIWFGGHIQIRRLRRQRTQQREFSRQLIQLQEQERKRIAGELHDSLGQNLLVAKNLALTGVNTSAQHPDAARLFGGISEVVSNALDEARSISKALRPPELDRLGLSKALGGMIQRAAEASGIRCQIEIEDIDGLLTEAEEINVYRLVQEAMNNIVKHAHARQAKITVHHHPDHLALRVEDDGRGFDVAESANAAHVGTGITAMEERTRLAGGEFAITSMPGAGTVLSLRIPVKPPPK